MMSFNDFTRKYKFKNEPNSKMKIYQDLSSLSLSDAGIFSRVDPIQSAIEIVKLQPSQGIHWVFYNHEYYFDSYA